MALIVLDKYEIESRLAVGGMGEIFLAHERGLPGVERRVVIKTLLPEFADDERRIQEFLGEGRVIASLSHPNIVATYDVAPWLDTYVLVMEYIDGPNLADVLKTACRRSDLVPPAIAARIVHDAALGLAGAHDATGGRGNSLGIIHRDISPHNIMVRKDGLTKVVDFGIARFAAQTTRTRTGVIRGKASYMAPEQLHGRELTPLTDQFSLGVVFWELLVCDRLFKVDANGLPHPRPTGPPPPSSQRHGIPDRLNHVTFRMLSTAPDDRFPSCAEVARAIAPEAAHPTEVAEFLAGLDIPGPTVVSGRALVEAGVLSTEPRRSSTRPRQRLPAVVAGLAVAIAAVALTLAFTLRPTPPGANTAPLAPATTQPAAPEPEPTPPAQSPSETQPEPDKTKRKQPRARNKASVAPKAPGTLTVVTKPWVSISIDGEPHGVTPLYRVQLTPGKHTLRLVNEEASIDVTTTIQITSKKLTKKVYDLARH